MLLARAMEYGDYLITPPCDLSPSGLWLLVPLSRPLVEEIECAGEDLPEDDELDEMDGWTSRATAPRAIKALPMVSPRTGLSGRSCRAR